MKFLVLVMREMKDYVYFKICSLGNGLFLSMGQLMFKYNILTKTSKVGILPNIKETRCATQYGIQWLIEAPFSFAHAQTVKNRLCKRHSSLIFFPYW